MAKIAVCGKEFDVDVVVFDKDGCLFETKTFWENIATLRYKKFVEKTNNRQAGNKWLNMLGIKYHLDDRNELIIENIDPTGPFAVPPPHEEMIICATIIRQELGWKWSECRETAKQVFEEADELLDLVACAKPTKGFPAIFDRLYKAGIPYGIATSDTPDRTKFTLSLVTSLDNLSFFISSIDVKNGKPNRETLDIVASKFNCDTSKIMMVGDSLVDVEMAKNAGSIGIGIPEYEANKKEMEPVATVIAESLDDIIVVE